MNDSLKGKNIAILVADGFEQVELVGPRDALNQAGARTEIVSPEENMVKGWNEKKIGDDFFVDIDLGLANPEDFDALLLPGGVMNPDSLRLVPEAVDFVRDFFAAGKPVAAICHGPQLLIEADVLRGRTVTSFPSLHTDLTNAGAIWVDRPVVTDHGLVTSRRPDDLPQFNEKMIEEFAEGFHQEQQLSAALSVE